MFTPKHILQIKIVVYTFFLIKVGDVMAVVKHWKYCFRERLWHQRQRFPVIQMSRLISTLNVKNYLRYWFRRKKQKKNKNLFVDANEWELYTNVNFGSQKNALKQKK